MSRIGWAVSVLLIAAAAFFTIVALRGKGALDGLVLVYAFLALLLLGGVIAADGLRQARRKLREAERQTTDE